MRKFTLGPNAAKSTDYIKKCFEQKLFRIKFPKKKSVGAYVYLPPPLQRVELDRLFQFQYIIMFQTW